MITGADDNVMHCDPVQFSVRDRAGMLMGLVLDTTLGGMVVGELWLLSGGG